MQEKMNQTVDMNALPFTAEDKGDHLAITAKMPENLTPAEQEAFKSNTRTVKLVYFDNAYFERIDKINREFKQNLSFKQRMKNISRKAIDFLMS